MSQRYTLKDAEPAAKRDNSGFDSVIIEEPGLSPAVYNLLIGLCLCWGIAANWLIVKWVPVDFVQNMEPLIYIIGYGVCVTLGCLLFNKSENPLLSFLGYNLVVLPFGLGIHAILSYQDASIVPQAIRITGLITILMLITGTLVPKFFERIALLMSSLLVIVFFVEMIELYIFGIHHEILHWVIAAIISAYIALQWARAQELEKTLDNAVDSAARLYMDIIQLFLRILWMFGRRRYHRFD